MLKIGWFPEMQGSFICIFIRQNRVQFLDLCNPFAECHLCAVISQGTYV